MPKVKLTKTFIDTLATPRKTIDYFDTEVKGLLLRVYHSGGKTYQIYYRNTTGEQKRYTLAKHGQLTLTQARELAAKRLAEIHSGIDVQANKIATRQADSAIITFGEYLNEFYYGWFKQNRKGDKSTINILKNTLRPLHDTKLPNITKKVFTVFISQYRNKMQVSNARVNRIISAFKGALTVAYKHNYTQANHLAGYALLHEDTHKIVRYLTEEEQTQLLNCLGELYYQYRNIVVLALNTGMRSREILTLEFMDINLEKRYIALRSENTKARKVRYIPLNQSALKALEEQKNKKITNYVFTNPITKKPYILNRTWFKNLLKAANIENFRFHDLRHTFASKLVMKGVDLNTVRELMGHSDIKMTLVYAHLAPEHKQKAVDLLC